MAIEPRSYPRQFSHLAEFKAAGGGYMPTMENHNHWNGKSSFPNLKLFSTAVGESSSKSQEPRESSRRTEERSMKYTGQVGRDYRNGFGPFDAYPPFPSRQQRKWTNNDLENYFTQMRLTPSSSSGSSPRGREIPKDVEHRHSTSSTNATMVIRPVPIRPGNMYRVSPATDINAPTEDDSMSGESMAISSGNTFNSINGSVSTNVPEKNKVILERIKRGLDHRTTIMVKNVPNKYTQVPLAHHDRDCVFWNIVDGSKCLWSMLILRIRGRMISFTSALIFKINASTSPTPIQNGVLRCSVGYAFINFIDPLSIIPFAKARVGTKWSSSTFFSH